MWQGRVDDLQTELGQLHEKDSKQAEERKIIEDHYGREYQELKRAKDTEVASLKGLLILQWTYLVFLCSWSLLAVGPYYICMIMHINEMLWYRNNILAWLGTLERACRKFSLGRWVGVDKAVLSWHRIGPNFSEIGQLLIILDASDYYDHYVADHRQVSGTRRTPMPPRLLSYEF